MKELLINMNKYFKVFILTSIVFTIYVINYVILRENEEILWLGNFLAYEFSIIKLIVLFIFTIPFLSYILLKLNKTTFSTLLVLIVLLAVLPSIVVYSFSDHPSLGVFLVTHVYILFFFSLFTRNRLVVNKNTYEQKVIINMTIIKSIVVLGVLTYIYLNIKYIEILSFKSINEIYTQRILFTSIIGSIESYFLLFSKTIATFASLVLAINTRKKIWLLPITYIFIIDYLLAGHKASLFLMIFCIFYYFSIKHISFKKYFLHLFVFTIFVVSIILNTMILINHSYKQIIISLYDRVFMVSVGSFSRIFEYTNEFFFFLGGSGFLGKIFGNDYSLDGTMEIGRYYFHEGVQANVNLIADGYLNFGILGAFFQVFILWLIFNKRDDYVFQQKFNLLFPFIFIYAFFLTSTSLNIALLSGGMFIFILILKFGFKLKIKEQNENT